MYIYPGYQRFAAKRRGEENWREEKRREGPLVARDSWLILPRQQIWTSVKIWPLSPADWRNLIAYSDWLLVTNRCVVIGCLLSQGAQVFSLQNLLHHDNKKDSLTLNVLFSWFASNIEPTRHSRQRSQWLLEFRIAILSSLCGGTLWRCLLNSGDKIWI